MIRINDPMDGTKIAAVRGGIFTPGVDQCIANISDRTGEILGGVLFQDFIRGASISMHMAAFDKHWITPDGLWLVFDYAFNQLGVKAIFGRVPMSNTHALQMDLRFGFKEVARVPDVFPEEAVILRMRREDCRWLGLKPRSVQSNTSYPAR